MAANQGGFFVSEHNPATDPAIGPVMECPMRTPLRG